MDIRDYYLQQQMNQQQQGHNPITAGTMEGMRAAKQSLQMNESENRRALGMAIMKFSQAMGQPGYKGGLAGVNQALAPALDAYGEQERYQTALNASLLQQQLDQERIHRQELEKRRMHEDNMGIKREMLGARMERGSAGAKRYAPSYIGKLAQERQEVQEGFLPGSNGTITLSPEEQQEALGRYDLALQKHTTDPNTRQRSLMASNLNKAFDRTNLDDLTRFSGASGKAKLVKESALDAIGQSSEEYKLYKEALTASKLEAKEIRQALGESITPEIGRQLDILTNPTNFSTSPETAKRQIKKAREILKKQLQTFQASLRDTSEFGGPKRIIQEEDESSEPHQDEDAPVHTMQSNSQDYSALSTEELRQRIEQRKRELQGAV